MLTLLGKTLFEESSVESVLDYVLNGNIVVEFFHGHAGSLLTFGLSARDPWNSFR